MNKADKVREYGLELVGRPYKLGEEFWYVVGTEQTKINDGDCSGLPYAVFRRAGVLLAGKPMPATWRWTAHDLYKKATRIPQPSRVGDLGFLLKNGHCYHTFMYVGKDQVVEAGDGTGKVGLRTVAHENARGTLWGRLNTDIGELEDDMTKDQDRLLKQIYVSLVSACNTDEIAIAIGKGDIAKAERLHAEAKAAGAGKKAELGI